jgi:hypothetical protein
LKGKIKKKSPIHKRILKKIKTKIKRMMTRFEKIKNYNYKFNDEIENKL